MKHTHHILAVCLLSPILFSHTIAVFSQEASSSLQGTVTDPNGALIRRARVTAKLRNRVGKTDPRLFETETDDEGQFTFRNLPAGIYEVRVSFEGSESQTEKIVSLRKGEAVEIAIQFGRGCDNISEGSGLINDSDKARVVKPFWQDSFKDPKGRVSRRRVRKTLWPYCPSSNRYCCWYARTIPVFSDDGNLMGSFC
jgi:hypothetical protein